MMTKRSESAEYLDISGEQIYTVRYEPRSPVGVVVLCCPFPPERLFGLSVWCKWGRYLASRNLAAIRFDYRGNGESTGEFSKMDFYEWVDDIESMVEWARSEFPRLPIFLHGLGMGGLLAAQMFMKGVGKALLMWSSPASGMDILKQGLVRRLSMDMLLLPPTQRRSANQYIEALKAGECIQVDGFRWSGPLWKSGQTLSLPAWMAAEGSGVDPATTRPWKHVFLNDTHAPLIRTFAMMRAMSPRAAFAPEAPLNPDLTRFFSENAAWLIGTLETSQA